MSLRVLFLKHSLAWPRASGHDVHSFHMMKAFSEMGVEVSLATVLPLDDRAVEGIPLALRATLATDDHLAADILKLTYLQRRVGSYFGVEARELSAVARVATACKADVVVAVGLEMLPYLAGVENATRVWYAADEWVYHHLSSFRLRRRDTWRNLHQAAKKGICERAYASVVDRVWVVSDTERRAARWFAGMNTADIVPNGVDTAFYRAVESREIPDSAVFWGRLDFGPNVEALNWFCNTVWPSIKRERPSAQFTIVGFNPDARVKRLTERPGISLKADVPDLRPIVSSHAVVVLPFISGGGIKNKLLEAAALGRPIVATPHSCKGLRSDGSLPLLVANTSDEWMRGLTSLWDDEGERRNLGTRARQWVESHHTWSAAARDALAGLQASGLLGPDQLQWAKTAIRSSVGSGATVTSVRRVPSRLGAVHRLVAKTEDAEYAFYLKQYDSDVVAAMNPGATGASGRLDDLVLVSDAVARAPGLVPFTVVGSSENLRLLLTAETTGRPLGELHRATLWSKHVRGDALRAWRGVGAWLNILHWHSRPAVDSMERPSETIAYTIERLRHWMQEDAARRTILEEAGRALTVLGTALARRTVTLTPCHGDVTAFNILVGERVGLIDFEDYRLDMPGGDLSQAMLEIDQFGRVFSGPPLTGFKQQAVEAFLQGYGRALPAGPEFWLPHLRNVAVIGLTLARRRDGHGPSRMSNAMYYRRIVAELHESSVRILRSNGNEDYFRRA